MQLGINEGNEKARLSQCEVMLKNEDIPLPREVDSYNIPYTTIAVFGLEI